MHEVALRAAGLLAENAHRLELVEEVGARSVDVQHAVDGLAAGGLHRKHQRRKIFPLREVVGHAESLDARLQGWLVGDALDAAAVDEDARLVAAQRFTVLGGRHQHACLRQAPAHCAESQRLAENPRLIPAVQPP
jgi:hypothetical protein